MSSSGGVAIREATPSDARAIAEIHVESWRRAYRDQLPGAFLEGLSVGEREWTWTEWLATREATSQTLVGVGRDLFAAATDRLRSLGFSRATLWVLASNDHTRRILRKGRLDLGWHDQRASVRLRQPPGRAIRDEPLIPKLRSLPWSHRVVAHELHDRVLDLHGLLFGQAI